MRPPPDAPSATPPQGGTAGGPAKPDPRRSLGGGTLAPANQGKFIFTLAAFSALALVPLLMGSFGLDLVTKVMVFAVFALSLELLVGTTGLVCFGQAAFFGIGAYATVLLSPQSEAGSLLWLLPAAMGSAALYALVVGALSLRTKGVYFIMVTLAFAQMAYYVVHDTPLGGGTDGIYLNVRPMLGSWLDLGKPQAVYAFTWGCLAATFAFLAMLLRSRFGRALAGIKANEQRMRAAGFSTLPYKLAAFVISGALAGLAGFLFAVKDGFVNPELLSWHFSGAVLIMVILGGLGHLRGALIGAFAFALLQELFKSEVIFGSFAKHWSLGLGLTIIACVALLPRGLVGLPAQWRERKVGHHDHRRGIARSAP
jgi:branched-chain amino acid transport system permease protein